MPCNYGRPLRSWEVTDKIISFTYPVEVNHSYYKRRQYMIVLLYDNNKTILKKKIYFGFKGAKNKLEDSNFESKRKERENPFHPYFWEKRFLHSRESLMEAFCDCVKELIPK